MVSNMTKSPFPGMNPYLEPYWLDVHHALIQYSRDQLQSRLPKELRARTNERVVLEDDRELFHSMHPDVAVIEPPEAIAGGAVAVMEQIAVAEPEVIPVQFGALRQPFLEIRDASNHDRVITVIEFVSPTNKLAGPGRTLYRRKQQDCLAAGVNLVEIDLTRTGKRELLGTSGSEHRESTYAVSVFRAAVPDVVNYESLPLTEPLPAIGIPLRTTDDDVPLELQPLIQQVIVNGRYEDLDTTRELSPPLTEAERERLRVSDVS
jgi:hypothetical protein